MNLLRRAIALTLIVSTCALSSGCIGRMALSGKVAAFNASAVEGRWYREALFIAMYIVPVYPTCATLDLLVVNSIEFWTFENPVSGDSSVAGPD